MIEDARAEESASAVSGLFGRDMIYMAVWGLQVGLAALLTPVATRLLLPSEFGRVAAAVAVMQLLNALLGFGLVTAVQRAHPTETGEDDARRLILLSIVMALIGGAIVYGTGHLWSPLIGLGDFPGQIRLAVAWAVLTAISGPALSLVRSRDQLRWFVAAGFAESLFAQALALVLVVAVKRTATEYMLGQTLGQLLSASILLAVARPARWARVHRRMLTDALKFSIPLVPALIAAFLLNASDRIVIHGDLGPAALGRYAVASNIGGFATLLLVPLDFVWLGRLFSIQDEEVRRSVMATSRDGLYLLMVAFAVAISVACPVILKLWSPAGYRPSTLYLVTGLVAASAIPAAGGMVYNQVLILGGRTRMVSAVALGGALFNLGLNLLLVPSLGIDGSAAITLVTSAGSIVVVHRLIARNALPNHVASMAIAVGGVALCTASAAAPGTGIALVLRLIVAVAASLLFLVRLATLISPELSEKLVARIRRRPEAPVGESSVPVAQEPFKLGILVTAHHMPDQLADVLALLGDPRIMVYVHVDSRSSLAPFLAAADRAGVANVAWLTQRSTSWGHINIIDAELEGLARAAADGCDYVLTISGQDFPLLPAADLVEFAFQNRRRSYVQAVPVAEAGWRYDGRQRTEFYSYRLRDRMYTCVPIGEDTSEINLRGRALNWVLRGWSSLKPPRRFPDYLDAYGGQHWLNLSADAVDHILRFVSDHPDYRRYHQYTACADEIFFQSILLGSGFAQDHEVINDDLRFQIWEPRLDHPQILRLDDLPAILSSGDLFARKLERERDPELYARLQGRVAPTEPAVGHG